MASVMLNPPVAAALSPWRTLATGRDLPMPLPPRSARASAPVQVRYVVPSNKQAGRGNGPITVLFSAVHSCAQPQADCVLLTCLHLHISTDPYIIVHHPRW